MGIKSWRSCFHWRLFVDFLLYISVLVPLLACYANLIPPMGGSFHCDDPSIQFQYQGDTVSTKILLSMVLLPLLFIVFPVEVFHVPHMGALAVCKRAAVATGQVFVRFWVSLTFNIAINMALKTMTAIPRPHFIDTCQPIWERINCSANGGNVDIDYSLCRGSDDDPKSVSDAMKSFPSGHAQMSCFAAAYVIVYLSARLHTTHSHLAKYWLQLLLVLMATFSTTSRVTDHRHHTMDVVVGAAIGIVIGVVAALGIVFPQYDDMEIGKHEKQVKQKRPSKIRLINSELGLGTVVDTERELKEVHPNPAS